jgi:hypothetical protein
MNKLVAKEFKVCQWGRRLFGVYRGTNRLKFSDVDRFHEWPELNWIDVGGPDGTAPIVDLHPASYGLVIVILWDNRYTLEGEPNNTDTWKVTPGLPA